MAVHSNLDPLLVCAVVEQESNWNTWAIRFEPAFLRHYIHGAANLNASMGDAAYVSTRDVEQSTSWGLMQLMGSNARDMGLQSIPMLLMPTVGLTFGIAFLKEKLAAHPGDVHAALQSWNGGGDPNYADSVLARRSHYTVSPPDPSGK